MDFALITNLLLFLGAMGVTFALDSGSSKDDDTEGDHAESDAMSQSALHSLHDDDDPQNGEDSLAADKDNLAWFLTSGDVAVTELPSNSFAMLAPPEAASEPSDEGTAQAEDSQEPATGAPAEAAHEDGTDLSESPGDDGTDPALPELAATDSAGTDPAETESAEDGTAPLSIELSYLPALDPETGAALEPELAVHPTEDGTGSVVWLDGLEVARFDDLPDLSPDQISLLPEEDTAAHAEADAQDLPDDPVLIEAFLPGADQIEIAYHPATDAAGTPLPPEIRVELTEDDGAQAALVLLDGCVVARVLGSGAANLRPADIVTTAV